MNPRHCTRPTVEELAAAVTGRRDGSLFAEDVAARRHDIAEAVAGRAVLVIGGAGSIGSATVMELLRHRPAALWVVDQNENALVELVRDVRSGPGDGGASLRTMALDFGSPLMRQFLAGEGPFDLILNFAAQKHVRSAKDRLSLLQLLDTNLGKARRLMRWLVESARPGHRARYFCVSTDKAANPVSVMGASKRLMEMLAFADGAFSGAHLVTSARFANVAFSDGSLLWGFLRRIEKGQPLAVPRATRRYFVSPAEAGQICLLAATIGPAKHVMIPRLDARADLVLLEDVAAQVVCSHGFQPSFYDDEQQARQALPGDVAQGRYPILRTALDTSGEKPFEEFVAADEVPVEIDLPHLLAIPQQPGAASALFKFLTQIEGEIERSGAALSEAAILRMMQEIVPQFAPVVTGKQLDARM